MFPVGDFFSHFEDITFLRNVRIIVGAQELFVWRSAFADEMTDLISSTFWRTELLSHSNSGLADGDATSNENATYRHEREPAAPTIKKWMRRIAEQKFERLGINTIRRTRTGLATTSSSFTFGSSMRSRIWCRRRKTALTPTRR
jgi:hypothetical protein